MSDPIWAMMEELHEHIGHLRALGLIKEPPKSVFQILNEAFEELSAAIGKIFFG